MINQIIKQPLKKIDSILQHQQDGNSTGANVSRAFKDLLMSPGALDQVGPTCQLVQGTQQSKLSNNPAGAAADLCQCAKLARQLPSALFWHGEQKRGTAVCHTGGHYSSYAAVLHG